MKARARAFHVPLRKYDVSNDPNPVADRSVFRMDFSGTTNRVCKADGDSDYLSDCWLPPRAVYRKREVNRLFSPKHCGQLLQHTSGQGVRHVAFNFSLRRNVTASAQVAMQFSFTPPN